jgi:alpha-D-ribose 1-methylphosphonate 5-triphosphate diphosphatase PhnM
LEKPEETAEAISEFITGDVAGKNAATTTAEYSMGSNPAYLVGGGFVGALAVAEALKLIGQAPPQ